MRMNLRRARMDLRMSTFDMASHLDVNERHYRSIESGEKMGSIRLWDKLEDLTGIHQRVLRENE